MRLRDGTEPGSAGGLEFDLEEVLDALGKRVADSFWVSSGLSYVSRDELDIVDLDRLGNRQLLSSAELLATLPRLSQIIDGELQGSAGQGAPAWVIVRAVDSSWWEVYSDEVDVLDAVRERFRVVEDLPGAA